LPWNGAGTFNRIYSWVADKAAGLDISSSRMDTDTDDIASNGFGNCLTRDGQGQPTANLPMTGFRHTGVGNAVATTDYAAYGQVQSLVQAGQINWIVAGGTADAITATYSPAITSLSDGLLCWFRATAANATTTPTFAPNGLTAHTITRNGGAALGVGQIAGNLAEVVLRYNLANTRWELLNPLAMVVKLNQIALFATPGTATYTPATNFAFAKVTVIAGGGAGGGAFATTGTTLSAGSGGGGGEMAFGVFTSAQVGASKTVTVGAGGNSSSGGNSSFGSLLTAIGGGVGNGILPVPAFALIGGAGGSGGTGGSVHLQGSGGGNSAGSASAEPFLFGGVGAPGYLGAGAGLGSAAPATGGAAAGNAATAYGAGGGGASNGISQVSTQNGGNGGGGAVIVEEYTYQV